MCPSGYFHVPLDDPMLLRVLSDSQRKFKGSLRVLPCIPEGTPGLLRMLPCAPDSTGPGAQADGLRLISFQHPEFSACRHPFCMCERTCLCAPYMCFHMCTCMRTCVTMPVCCVFTCV